MKCPNCGREMAYDFEGSVQWVQCYTGCGKRLYLSERTPRQTIIDYLKNKRYEIVCAFANECKRLIEKDGQGAILPNFDKENRIVGVIDELLSELGEMKKT